MKRIGFALVIAAAAGSSACVDADASILLTAPVLANCEIDEEAGTSSCTYGGRDEATRLADVLTVNINELSSTGQAPFGNGANTFTFGVALQNRLLGSDDYSPIGEEQNLRIDQNIAIIDTFSLTFPSDSNQAGVDALDTEFKYSVEVETSDSSSGAAVALVSASNAALWKQVFTSVTGGNNAAIVPAVVEVQALGKTIGGQDVESNIVSIPLNICLGCAYGNTPYGTAE